MSYPPAIRRILQAFFRSHFHRDALMIEASLNTLKALAPYYGIHEQMRKDGRP